MRQNPTRRIEKNRLKGIPGDPNGAFEIRWQDKRVFIISSDGMGWEHVSVSTPNETPSWDLMCYVKDLFWSGEEWVIQFHPAKSDYINCHPHCLHLWKPTDQAFPTPPSILTGFKENK